MRGGAAREEMTLRISEILGQKGHNVESTSVDVALEDVAKSLCERDIGALVVLDADGQPVGIVTERNIVRALAETGTSASESVVGDVMGPVVTCALDDDVRNVSAQMTRQRARHLLVLDDGDISGVISLGDIVNCQLSECRLEVGVLRDYARTRSIAGVSG